jgi:hypothetical protein
MRRPLAKQRGAGLLAVVIATLVIVGAILWSLGGTRRISVGVPNTTTQAMLVSQAIYLRGAVLNCVINYPQGNTGAGTHRPYPPSNVTDIVTDGLLCPGNNNIDVLTGADGLGQPATITGFSRWKYVKEADPCPGSVCLTISDTTGGTWATAIDNAVASFGSSAARSGNTFVLTIVR